MNLQLSFFSSKHYPGCDSQRLKVIAIICAMLFVGLTLFVTFLALYCRSFDENHRYIAFLRLFFRIQ
ncbi:uncharacterized protein Dvar_39030 [Desulfosarcina variabilis str. Montpellier]